MTDLVEIVARAIDRSDRITTESGANAADYPEDAAYAALAAIKGAGFAVVPVVPTSGMVDRGYMASEPLPTDTVTSPYARVYTAMIQAAG